MKQSNALNSKKIKVNVFTDFKYALFLLFLYFFVFDQILENYIGFLNYADELIAAVALVLFFINGFIYNDFKIEKYSLCVVIFLIIGLAGNFIFEYQPFVAAALPDAFINAKFWLAIYFGKCVFCDFDFKLYAKAIYFHLKLIILLFVALTLADNLFEIYAEIPEYGFRSTHLFYGHPTHFTWTCVLLCTILMCIRKYVKYADLFFVICLILMCSTLKIKALTTVLAFLLIFYYVIKKHKRINILVILFFLVIALIVGWNKIEYYFFSNIQNDSARYQLLITSFSISDDHFPIGSGFGTFASYFSGVHYSVLYSMYKISNVYGITSQNAAFINDSFWPMILGQTGIIGLIFFVAALVFLYLKIKRLKKIDIEIFGTALMIIVAILISSAMESAFVHPDCIPLAVILGILLAKNKNSKLSQKK